MTFCRPVARIFLAAILLTGCQPSTDEASERGDTRGRVASSRSVETPGAIRSAPLKSRAGSEASPAIEPLFESLASDRSGIDFVNPIDTEHPRKFLYASSMGCGGIAIADVDQDGLADIYLSSGPRKNRLYRQVGDLRFEDITDAAGVDGDNSWGTGVALVDIDGDGDLDIYVCNYVEPNQLYIQQDNLTFKEEAAAWGLDIVDASHTPAFCDYDADGDVDLYLLTNRHYRVEGFPEKQALLIKNGRPYVLPEFEKHYAPVQIAPGRYRLDVVGRPDRLLRNDGRGHFVDVSKSAGLRGRGHGLSATWFDVDGDGQQDLYVGNDFDEPDQLYRNNGDGTFRETIREDVPYTSWFSMGADFADLNNDGLLDFVIADMHATTHFKQKTLMGAMDDKAYFRKTARPQQYMRNMLQLNGGGGRFFEVSFLAGLARTDWTWAVKLSDFDNDGLIDAFFSNGMSRSFNEKDDPVVLENVPGKTQWDRYEHKPPMPEQNLAYRNLGELQFADVSREWGLDRVGMTYAVASGDLDRDGDVDLVQAHLDAPVTVHRNRSKGGHRMLVRLEGVESHSQGVGATVRVEAGGQEQVRQLTLLRGYMSQDDPLLHFGLGEYASVSKLSVDWPSGHRQVFENLQADRLFTVTEPGGKAPAREPVERPPTLFRRRSADETGLESRHRERPFDDLRRQPLLPRKLSRLGPGMAWGDADGDGDEDLFVGAAAGSVSQFFINLGRGRFSVAPQEAFERARDSEDMGAAWFDQDGDGDLDLYVVSGGIEAQPGATTLRDRLYLNDGSGQLTQAPLPDARESGSVVAVCDYDRDGDLDLFVGSRSVPGSYPEIPDSRLYRLDGKRYRVVTDKVAPGLRQTGLVTSAVWSDANGDGWIDLLVTHDWGPVKVFLNEGGASFRDATDAAGLASLVGWWNGIAARDLDGDRDIDFVVTNTGLNTGYDASPERPAVLYYGEFQGDGQKSIVEAWYEGERLLPWRDRPTLTQALPFLGEKFQTFRDFAQASLTEVFSAESVRAARRLAATTLASGVLINDGKARFTFHPLPRLAQSAPAFGVIATEVDGDGHADIYLVQNDSGLERDTGSMSGGLSLLMTGRGDGTFAPVWPDRSGLYVSSDARSLSTIDINGDVWPDCVVAINGGELTCFENAASSAHRVLGVRLQFQPGNPTAIGARVTLWRSDGKTQTAEVSAGGGYLSQSSAELVFGLGQRATGERLDIHWPDGSAETVPLGPEYDAGGTITVPMAR